MCRADTACLHKQFRARVFLGKTNVVPPKKTYIGLMDDKAVEISGPSYRRQKVRFRKTKDGGFDNETPVIFKVRDCDEEWNVHYAALMANEEPGADCNCTAF